VFKGLMLYLAMLSVDYTTGGQMFGPNDLL